MDPNAALANLRDAVRRAKEFGTNGMLPDIIESFEALDSWLMRGGFLPQDWADAQEADKAALRAALARPAYGQKPMMLGTSAREWRERHGSECLCHRESGSHEQCCGHEDGRNPDCPQHGDGSTSG